MQEGRHDSILRSTCNARQSAAWRPRRQRWSRFANDVSTRLLRGKAWQIAPSRQRLIAKAKLSAEPSNSEVNGYTAKLRTRLRKATVLLRAAREFVRVETSHGTIARNAGVRSLPVLKRLQCCHCLTLQARAFLILASASASGSLGEMVLTN